MNCLTTRRAGFTLIELMIAVALVGLLAAIAIPNFIRSRKVTQTNLCINNLRIIDSAVQQWALEMRQQQDATVQFADISSYLKRSVLCPAGGTSFADSYVVTVVGAEPVCQKVPLGHLLPQLASVGDTSSANGNGNGNGNGGPPSSHGNGNGPGNNNGQGNGNGP